ncbi:MAG: hypothetical protein NVV74_11515 [Magnetospirillum sp.]|nr:hypothetical protein [Magnetospirillum sp.]
MTPELATLVVAALCLGCAIVVGRQGWLMAAVLGYTAAVDWIIHRDLTLLMPALSLAIVLGVMGLGIIVQREILSLDDTSRHHSSKINANNLTAFENVGS